MRALRTLLAVGLVAVAGPASATTLTFQNGFGGYTSADNESYSFDGTSHQDQIRVDFPSAAQPEGSYAWVIFDDLFGAGAVPDGVHIVSAFLEGFVINPFLVADVTRLLQPIEDRPFGAGSSVLDSSGVFFDDKQIVPAFHPACANGVECNPAVPISWDVTDMVQTWSDGAPNFGFLLLPETPNGGKVAPTDAVALPLRPRLVVEYQDVPLAPAVPEPASLLLLALALPALARRRA